MLLGALSPPAAAALALCRSLSPGTGDDCPKHPKVQSEYASTFPLPKIQWRALTWFISRLYAASWPFVAK